MASTTPKLNLPYPTPDDTVDVPRDVSALANAIDAFGVVPAGAMMMWPGPSAPTGWLLCQGQTNIAAATHPILAGLFGQTGGNVNMPDLQGRVPIGAGAAAGVPNATAKTLLVKGGEEKVTLTTGEMPSHSHNYAVCNNTVTVNAGALANVAQVVATIATDPTGGGQPHNNLPPYLPVNYIVREG